MKKPLFLCSFLALANLVGAQQNIAAPAKTVVSPIVNADGSVTFSLRAPNAQRVTIKGDWDWKPTPMTKNDDGIWTHTGAPMPSDLYIYNYDVDGTQIIDPASVFAIRDVNSLFTSFYIGGGNGDKYQVHDVAHGNVVRTWYNSPTLKADRRLTVYTPAGYGTSNAAYPVLYLLHGSGGDEEAWLTLGCVARIMDNLIAQGAIKPMLVVMPNGNPAKSAAPGETAENLAYTPAPSHNFLGYHDGSYESAFNEIVAFVESHYKVKAEKKSRAIAGLSMGGYHSLYIAANHRNTFDYIGLFSPGIKTNGIYTQVQAYEELDLKLTRQKKDGYQLYLIAIGKDDFLYSDVKEFRTRLDSLQFSYTYVESARGHVWSNWRAYLLDFLPQLF